MSDSPRALTPQENALNALRRWTVRIVVLAAVIYGLYRLFQVFVSLATTYMWFDSVHDGSVYSTMLWAKIWLWVIFAVIGGAVGAATIIAVRRARPRLELDEKTQVSRKQFRRYEHRLWPLVFLAGVLVPAVSAGTYAAANWQTYLLWANAQPWGKTDPQWHKDVSFYMEVLPFHRELVALFATIFTTALAIAVIASYFYGGWRFRGPRKITRPTTRIISLLLAGYLITKAFSYWVNQYSVLTENHGVTTGVSYTDTHANIPATWPLIIVAVIGAAIAIANFLRWRRVRFIAASLAVLVAGMVVFGTLWPKAVWTLIEKPSEATKDIPEIAHNQAATADAYALRKGLKTVAMKSQKPLLTGKALQAQGRRTAQYQLVDPNRMSPTFNVKQELQAYYHFKSPLDIDHYTVNGKAQDVAIAVRELQSSGEPSHNWVTQHLVYTHGYGVVAAPTNRIDASTESPYFLNAGIPPAQDIPVSQPDVYFGQLAKSYAIVGHPKGSKRNLEFNHPGGNNAAGPAQTTYAGNGGIPLGSLWRRFLFAYSLNSPNIFFSGDINKASQLLMIRTPRARVAQVAPWLTLDGDVYPAVVNGQIDWIVDGYTTSPYYPNSQMVNLRKATTNTLTSNSSIATQPSTNVNYMRNSVKAVVNAYTGKVTLYQWNENQQPDPLLNVWKNVFPGLVKPQSSIPSALLPHLRYPRDLFDVQRLLLAKYHVTKPAAFYAGNDFWKIPSDPTLAANKQINTTSGPGSVSTNSGPVQPPLYMSLSPTGIGAPQYSLSSPMVTLNRRELSGFLSVNSQPGPDYGKFTMTTFPSGTGGEAPSQVQNDIESSTKISEALTLQRGGNSKVVLGDLQAVPLAGRMLYMEPVYTQATGSNSFPVLRHVIFLYGNGDPSFEDSLGPALSKALTSGASR